MQNFTDIPSSRTLSDSLVEILNNDKTAISCNSGTTFPTTSLQIGMLCYRSDQLKLYQLIGTNPDNWRFIMDLSSGIDAQFAAKLNAGSYTAADVLAKLLTVDGSGSGLDADLLDGQHASAFAAAGHNHDASYLGKTAKAADSELLDGFNSTAFLRSVNGAGPDVNGNVAVNVDLSSRVAKTGDTMSGNLTVPSIYASNWFRSQGATGWYSESYAVGIYATEAGNVRTYNGANFIAGGNVTAYSDERLKTNWRPLPKDYVEQLALVKSGIFDRTDNEFAKTQVGVSAQSLRKPLWHAVLEGQDGYLSVNYGAAALVSTVELAKRVVELTTRLALLEAKLNAS